MLPTTKSVKQTAKELLKDKWPQLIAVASIAASGYIFVLLIEQVLRMALGGNQTLGGAIVTQNLRSLSPAVLLAELGALLLLLFFWQPLYLGVQRWFWRLSGGADDTVGGLFYYFGSGKRYGRALLFQLSLAVRVLLTGLVAFAPAIVAYVLTLPDFYAAIGVRAPLIITELWSLPGGLAALGLIAFIPWVLRYFLSAYLLINDPDLSPWQAVTLSTKVTRGSRAAYLGLLISFIGWLLLCLLALPVLFVLPYMMAAGAVFARYAIKAYNTGLQRAPSYGMY